MSQHIENRRQFLTSNLTAVGSLALAWLLKQDGLLAEPTRPELAPQRFDLLPKPTPQPPRATAMISLWMQGGPSHLDLFDPKPELNKRDGEKFPGEIKYDNAAQASAKMLGSPWKFAKYGQCGMDFSELLPHTASVADELCLIRSMRTGVNNHGQSIRAMNNGQITEGQPSLGSWMVYALGSESQDLPAYLALIDPGQLPVLGVENWANGYLPSLFQGTVVRPQEPRILNLTPPAHFAGAAQQRYLSFLERLNERHLKRHPGELDLEARIASYELAARMQSAATEALDISRETAATHKMYGLDEPATADYGARCLIARRLVERGVRFVQVFTANQFWDNHNNLRTSLPRACQKVDKPAAALVKDLKQRGLLDTTLVHWGGEMGRLPVIQNDAGPEKVGRDHNTHGFSMWLAGGGVKSGYTHGSTDDFGHQAVTDIVNHYDYHATLLHLFGVTPDELSYTQGVLERRLLNNPAARIVSELLV
ncbi:MAG: DUF1501 domain-containing protein [Planctomycetales bacterium]|nr:DUF1501 domain-containing protein [Planctomycetales bacterium]